MEERASFVSKEHAFVEALNSFYKQIYQYPSNAKALEEQRKKHKAFLDQCQGLSAKILPYSLDRASIEISNVNLWADKSTCIKFIDVLASIVRSNFDFANSIQAI